MHRLQSGCIPVVREGVGFFFSLLKIKPFVETRKIFSSTLKLFQMNIYKCIILYDSELLHHRPYSQCRLPSAVGQRMRSQWIRASSIEERSSHMFEPRDSDLNLESLQARLQMFWDRRIVCFLMLLDSLLGCNRQRVTAAVLVQH